MGHLLFSVSYNHDPHYVVFGQLAVQAANTLSGIVVSHWIANQSDSGLSRIKIIQLGALISFFAVIGLGVSSNYVFLMVTGMALFAAVSPIQPQIFAMARDLVEDGPDATVVRLRQRQQRGGRDVRPKRQKGAHRRTVRLGRREEKPRVVGLPFTPNEASDRKRVA